MVEHLPVKQKDLGSSPRGDAKNNYMSSFKWYRKLRGGNWKYVGPKYTQYSCWIRNEEPLSFEFVWFEEQY